MYQTQELPDKDYLSIKLIDEQLVYHYTKVKISGEDRQLTYEIAIDENPNEIDTSVDNEPLNRKLGYVLLDLIEQGTIDDGKHK